MEKHAIMEFENKDTGVVREILVPLSITANELILSLNEAYGLGMDTENIFNCFLVAENPIAFVRGSKILSDFKLRNGTRILYSKNS